jgi:hypothetical protein
MPDDHCKGVDVADPVGRVHRYNVDLKRDASFEPRTKADEKALRELGCFSANQGGRVAGAGFPCPCGFSSLFRRCSRCGADNPRE